MLGRIGSNQHVVKPSTAPLSNHLRIFIFAYKPSVDGLGAAMGSYPFVMDDIKRDNLVAPFGFVLSGCNYVLLSQDKKRTELEHKFITWLQTQMVECVPLPSQQNTQGE